MRAHPRITKKRARYVLSSHSNFAHCDTFQEDSFTTRSHTSSSSNDTTGRDPRAPREPFTIPYAFAVPPRPRIPARPSKKGRKYYAVVAGLRTGVFDNW